MAQINSSTAYQVYREIAQKRDQLLEMFHAAVDNEEFSMLGRILSTLPENVIEFVDMQ